MVPKPDGSWRLSGDFCRLNNCTDDDRYPLPHIQEFGSSLHGNEIFSVLDLQRGYHQIPMLSLIHISEAHETSLHLVCRLLYICGIHRDLVVPALQI